MNEPRRYTQLRTSGRSDLASRLPLAQPLALYVETTNRCNFTCELCPTSFPDYASTIGGITTLPFEVIERVFGELRRLGTGRLAALKLYGEGEPLLNKDLPKIVSLAHALEVTDRVEVTTNGSALTPSMGRALLEAGLDYLRVSIYGVSEEEHRLVTHSSVSAERIRQNVAEFRRLRDEGGFQRTLIYAKIIGDADSPRAREFLERYGPLVDEAAVEPEMNWNGYEGRTLAPSGLVRDRARAGKQVCPFPFYSLVVKANGDCVACCVDWNKATRVGNVHEQSFGDIWNGSTLRAFRQMHLERRADENPSCRHCRFHETCPDDLDHVPSSEWQRILGPG